MMKSKNIDPSFSARLPTLYSNFLTRVETVCQYVPIGWGGEIGKIMADNLLMLLNPFLTADSSFNEFSEKDIREELEKYKAYCNIHVVWGQKNCDY